MLKIGPEHLRPLFMYVSSKGSGKTVHMYRFVLAFTALTYQNLILFYIASICLLKSYLAIKVV